MDLRTLQRALGGEISGGQVLAPGPGHSPQDRSLAVRIDPKAPDGFLTHSFANDDPIQCRDHVRAKAGLPAFKANGGEGGATREQITAQFRAAVASQRSEKRAHVAVRYDYRDETGALLYQVERLEPKSFRQRKPDGKGGWEYRLGDVRRVLYRLPELLKYPDATTFVTEGEKDCDAVAALGHCATTVASGRWAGVDLAPLKDRDCIILRDIDEPGRKKALAAARALHGIAKTIRIVELPGLTGHPNNKDVSDWLDADPRRAERLPEIAFDAPVWEPDQHDGDGGEGRAEHVVDQDELAPEAEPKVETRNKAKIELNLTFFDQITDAVPKPWLIKNVIARGETSSWIAQPGKGKSALLIDIAIHLAAGKDWRGHRTKGRSGVVIFALERADLVRRRLIAHRLRDDLPALPIAVVGQVIDLMHKSCADQILTAVQRAEEHFGCPVGLVIIDTYPKGIAAGGGDESLAKDQNIAVANMRRVLDRAHIHIAGIGHTGKDESRGERGSNARLADVDLLVHLTGDTIKTATVKKANDQAEDTLTSFRLEPFDFGPDEDGDPFRTFILSDEIITGIATKGRPLSDRQRLALEALAETVLTYGQDAPTDYQLPYGIKVVAADQWRAEMFRRNVLDSDAKNPRARFNELRTSLAAKKLIGVRDDTVWAVHTQ